MQALMVRLNQGSVALLGAIALLSSPLAPRLDAAQAQPRPTVNPPLHLADTASTLALAKHLRKIGAKMYGAYWCPHCKNQIDLFGTTAFRAIDYVECDPRGKNPRPQLCKSAKIRGYPTWEINGKLYPGVQSLEELAETSGYPGKSSF